MVSVHTCTSLCYCSCFVSLCTRVIVCVHISMLIHEIHIYVCLCADPCVCATNSDRPSVTGL